MTLKDNLASQSPKIQFRATVNDTTVKRVASIAEIVRKQINDKPVEGDVIADLVEWVYKSKTRLKELQQFYTDEWLNKLEPVRNKESLQLRWRTTAHDALKDIAVNYICDGNKSEALRVVIAFAAKHLYKLPLER